MRYKQHVLLAGVASLALMAGASLAAAQGGLQSPGAAAPSHGAGPAGSVTPNGGGEKFQGKPEQTTPMNSPNAAPNGNATPGSGAAANEHTDQGSPQNAAQANQRNKADRNKARSADQQHNQSSAQNRTKVDSAQRMERNGSLKGLQGNTSKPMQGAEQQRGPQGAAGGNVELSEQQRTSIHDTVINAHNAPRVGHVNFDISVGTVVPRRDIHIVPVPETLVQIEPQWRGFLYFVYEDEVVIVNPRDMKIVAVVAA